MEKLKRRVKRSITVVKNVVCRLLCMMDNPTMVLVYHRIADVIEDHEQLCVSPQNFRKHLEYFVHRFELGRLEEGWQDSSTPRVILTFDDGYADNLINALPIMKEYGVPATFFISSHFVVNQKEFWWDELCRIFWGSHALPTHLRWPRDEEFQIESEQQKKIAYEFFHKILKFSTFAERERILQYLFDWAALERRCPKLNLPLSPDQLRILGREPLATIGAHTSTHAALSGLSRDEQIEEIILSKRILEDLISKKIEVFSYPFGGKIDYSDISIEICSQGGFKFAASNFPGLLHSWTSRYEIPRFLIRNWNEEELDKYVNNIILP